MNEKHGSLPASSNAYVESNPSHAPDGAHQAPAFSSQVRITFYHTRAKLADIDGLSGKAAIDGLVDSGILADDTAKQVAEVRHYQIKGKPEETKIVIEEL